VNETTRLDAITERLPAAYSRPVPRRPFWPRTWADAAQASIVLFFLLLCGLVLTVLIPAIAARIG
jgi:hypothetical protein